MRRAGFPHTPYASTGRLSDHMAGSSSSGQSTVAPARHPRGCSSVGTWRSPATRTRRVPVGHAVRSSGRKSLAESANHRTRWRNAPKLPNKALHPKAALRGRGERQSLGQLGRSSRIIASAMHPVNSLLLMRVPHTRPFLRSAGYYAGAVSAFCRLPRWKNFRGVGAQFRATDGTCGRGAGAFSSRASDNGFLPPGVLTTSDNDGSRKPFSRVAA